MTIKSEFETLIVCRDIIDERFEGGWRHWIEKFSMEDDGALSRVSAMSGHDIARAERKVIKLGLRPPIVQADSYIYVDYFIYAFEYCPNKDLGLSLRLPDWLILNKPLISEMSFPEIAARPFETQINPGRPTFDFKKSAIK